MKPSLLSQLLLLPMVTAWELSLFHVNDIHARMEETNKHSSPCTAKDAAQERCYGGLARLLTAVSTVRDQDRELGSDATVWLNAGDFYQGTLWYSRFKWRAVAQFNAMMDFDAMTLGNHEFDDGFLGLEPFLRNITCPVVVSNMDTSNVPELEGLYQTSIVLERGDKRIGIVGYLTPFTLLTTNAPELLKLTDEVKAVTKEVAKLRDRGVDIVIALGHSGYAKDIEIAESVPDIDIVVGAHTHSFLFTELGNRTNPSNNQIQGDYPTVVTNTQGNKVLVVQAFAFTKYLGHLKVNFTADGLVSSWQGQPILLDKTFHKDPGVEAAMLSGKEELDMFRLETVGVSDVFLNTSRKEESTMGDLVTDAMVWAYRGKRDSSGDRFRLALHHSGGLRTELNPGNITLGGLMNVFPFEHTLDSLSLAGKHLRAAMEIGVDRWEGSDGGFLQVSGIHVDYNIEALPGQRVCKVEVLCAACREEVYEELEDEKIYSILIPSYAARGGDGFISISDNKMNYEMGDMDTDVLQGYLASHSPVSPSQEGRIVIGRTCSQTSGTSRVIQSVNIVIMLDILSWLAGLV